ncbi:MAG TPA: NlpC/P60 family protein [Actinocatenispora sp.]
MRRRPWLASVGLAAAILFAGIGTSTAAYADPVSPAANGTGDGTTAPGAPPDPGSAPRPGGSVSVPSTGAQPGANLPTQQAPAGPMGNQIAAKTAQVQSLAERKKQLKEQLGLDADNVAAAKRNLDLANALLAQFEDRTGQDASKAYKSAAKIPDHLDPAAREYRELAKLAPWLAEPGAVDGRHNGASYQDAKKLATAAKAAYDRAVKDKSDHEKDYKDCDKQLTAATADLRKLRADNATALQQEEEQQRRWAQQYDGSIGSDVDGWQANPKAVAAVKFALEQLGKPYVWAAEGPDSYDCSGLVLASYNSVGVGLPRIADEQYRATAGRPVSLSQLLPGDLIFYGNTPGQSTSIYHVAMYVGQGRVVQAPTFGVPVQVASLSLGGFYGATRVVPAVRTKPKPKPHPSPSPSRSGPKSPSPTPSKSHTPGGSTSPDPSHSASPSPGPSTPSTVPTPGSSAPSAGSASPSTSTTSASAPATSSTRTSAAPSSTTSAAAPSESSTRTTPVPSPSDTCPSPSPSSSATPTPIPTPSPSRSGSPSPSPSCS